MSGYPVDGTRSSSHLPQPSLGCPPASPPLPSGGRRRVSSGPDCAGVLCPGTGCAVVPTGAGSGPYQVSSCTCGPGDPRRTCGTFDTRGGPTGTLTPRVGLFLGRSLRGHPRSRPGACEVVSFDVGADPRLPGRTSRTAKRVNHLLQCRTPWVRGRKLRLGAWGPESE